MDKKYSYRSLHIDSARHFFSVSTIKKVIKGISIANMNVLHWHLSDDPSQDDREFLQYIEQKESLIVSYITGRVQGFKADPFNDLY